MKVTTGWAIKNRAGLYAKSTGEGIIWQKKQHAFFEMSPFPWMRGYFKLLGWKIVRLVLTLSEDWKGKSKRRLLREIGAVKEAVIRGRR